MSEALDRFVLRRGLNLGGWLSQSDLSECHVASFLGEDDLTRIVGWGFDHVRVPLDWQYVMVDDHVRPAAATMLRRLHDWVTGTGLQYILDLHEAPIHTFATRDNALWRAPGQLDPLADFWTRVLDVLPDHTSVSIDLLNEPTTRHPAVWTELAGRLVERIRPDAPSVWIVVEGVDRGAPWLWREMSIPDRWCVLGVHFYEPIAFTHQRAFWSEVLPYSEGTQTYPGWLRATAEPVPEEFRHCFNKPWDRAAIMDLLRPAAVRAAELGVPIHCGEFGVYLSAPAASRYAWLSDVLTTFDELDMGWCYWSYRNMGFGVAYDEGDFARMPEYRTGIDHRLLAILTRLANNTQ